VKRISFNNKEYIKASEVAKKFRYTQDYVGQLCRNKKVDARLVGRTWFVVMDSVTEYRKTKHTDRKTKSVNKSKNNPVFINKHPRNTKPTPVAAVIRSKTAKNTSAQLHHSLPHYTDRVAISYDADQVAMIPVNIRPESFKQAEIEQTPTRMIKEPTIKRVIKLNTKSKSNQTKLRVAHESRNKAKFTAEKIPEISLSGKLKVHEAGDSPTAEDLIFDVSDSQDNQALEQTLTISQSVAQPRSTANSANSTESKENFETAMTPALNRQPGVLTRTTPILILLLAVVCGVSILAVSAQTEVGSIGTSSSFSFGIDQLLMLVLNLI